MESKAFLEAFHTIIKEGIGKSPKEYHVINAWFKYIPCFKRENDENNPYQYLKIFDCIDNISDDNDRMEIITLYTVKTSN